MSLATLLSCASTTHSQRRWHVSDIAAIPALSRSDLISLLEDRSRFIRTETLRLIAIAKAGHYTSVFSCAEIFATLYYHAMRIRPEEPGWRERDRFLMGK